MTAHPPPASSDAIALGCLCPRTTNNDGRGVTDRETGKRYWLVGGDCPVHRFSLGVAQEGGT